jgi:hypothetical protein
MNLAPIAAGLAGLEEIARSWSAWVTTHGGAALLALAAVLGLRWAARAASPNSKGALLLLALAPLALPMPRLPLPPLRLPRLQSPFATTVVDVETVVVMKPGGKWSSLGPPSAPLRRAKRRRACRRPPRAARCGRRARWRSPSSPGCSSSPRSSRAGSSTSSRCAGRCAARGRSRRASSAASSSRAGCASSRATPVASPATIGFLRPTIVLPARACARRLGPRSCASCSCTSSRTSGAATSGSARSHGCSASSGSSIPRPWIVGRLFEGEREAACDDAALAAFELRARRACAGAFLKVVELARGGPRLAVVAAMSRDGRDARSRLLRMVDPGRPLARRLSGGAWLALAVSAAGLLVLLQPQRSLAATGGGSAATAFAPPLAAREPELADAVRARR